jgi:uncharacterized protein (TIGR02117 family)
MLRAMRVLNRALAAIVCLPFAALALYTLAAFGVLLLTPDVAEPEDGVLVYACDNGVHTDLVVPVAGAGVDWRVLFRPGDFSAPTEGYDHVGLGWGSRDFYLNTPTWADVDFAIAARSVLWDESVLHVEYRPRPGPAENCRQWRADPASYARIAGFVRETLRLSQGLPTQAGPAYDTRDAFYVANGRYTILETCNQWTGRALRLAGAPVAPWTPYSFLVTWNMPMISK